VEIEDPGDLASYLPPSGGHAWLRRGDGMVGIGEVARFEGGSAAEADEWWQQACARIEQETELPEYSGTGPIAFASFVFDATHSAHRSVVIVPRLVIGRRKGTSWLTSIGGVGGEVPAMPPRQSPPACPPATTETSGSLGRRAWQGIVETAVGRIAAGALDKVVLARATTLAAPDRIDPRALVRRLAERYPSCWTYHVEGLVGASPEMLIRREGGLATSRVLAGTIRRSPASGSGEVSGEELDLKLAHALARSGKNLIEHELAVESVAHALEPFCSGMNVPDAPYVLELPNVLHLASDVTAVVHEGVSVLRLAGELHPSAAVCGTPTTVARDTIAELEHLDRGRYSGPVGWVDSSGDGEFAIALRCGLLSNDQRAITIYAGCGIVAESDPEEEFAETEAKLMPMLEALALG
jgi:menaquinone-specific isochorismate synthase